jgi:hypothetical protein
MEHPCRRPGFSTKCFSGVKRREHGIFILLNFHQTILHAPGVGWPYLHPVPKLGMHGTVHSLLHTSLWCGAWFCTGTNLLLPLPLPLPYTNM